jgi:hypothetical protein
MAPAVEVAARPHRWQRDLWHAETFHCRNRGCGAMAMIPRDEQAPGPGNNCTGEQPGVPCAYERPTCTPLGTVPDLRTSELMTLAASFIESNVGCCTKADQMLATELRVRARVLREVGDASFTSASVVLRAVGEVRR